MGCLRYTTREIHTVAKELFQIAGDLKIWTFSGDMGAGKTTLIAALCEVLGVKDQISSPTYSIIQEYHSIQGTVYHIDAYRLKDSTDAFNIGLDEVLESGSYCFIEWAEKIIPLLPEHYFSLHINGSGIERTLTYCII